MYLKNKILINNQQIPVNEIEISKNHNIFAWNNDKKIFIIRDKNMNDKEIEHKLEKFFEIN